MTTHTNLAGYLDNEYLTDPYLTATQWGLDGMQVNLVIQDQDSQAMQAELFALTEAPNGMQVEGDIGAIPSTGMQTELHIVGAGDDSFNGMQVESSIIGPDDDSFNGMQAEFIVQAANANAMEIKADTLSHKQHDVYLVDPYLEGNYLSEQMCAFLGMQTEITIVDPDDDSFNGMQTEMHIVGPDDDDFNGMQTELTILDEQGYGFQIDAVSIAPIAMQVLATLYNTNNLRILCDFPSRGNSEAVGNNQWGNAAGQGRSWKVNVPTDTGPDHEIENLNTDIVEQTWKAANAKTGIQLDCDTERAQGVFLDTLAILNHNFTGASNIQLFGSNDPTFGVIGITRSLSVIAQENNILHIEEELPNVSFRYWRITIDDATNPDPIEIGTIVFGASQVLHGECIVDEIDLQRKDFADSINTEGFTNVMNSRTQKKLVRIRFQSLAFDKGNYQKLRDIFTGARTVLKCLWIPTPDINDQEFMSRFAVFAKISQIPMERHNSKGSKADFASFPLELDESN